MKRIIALVVAICVFVGGLPFPAQAQKRQLARSVKTVTNPQKYIFNSQAIRQAQAKIFAGRTPIPTGLEAADREALQTLRKDITQAVRKQLVVVPIGAQEIIRNFQLGKTQQLASQILIYPGKEEIKASLLRNQFVSLAVEGKTSLGNIEKATAFFRQDIQKKWGVFEALKFPISKDSAKSLKTANEVLGDAAALALLGTESDLALLTDLYHKTLNTPFAPVAAAHTARAWLRMGNYQKLIQFLTEEEGIPAELIEGIRLYCNKQLIPVFVVAAPRIPLTQVQAQSLQELLPLLRTSGKVNELGGDLSYEATTLWMGLSQRNTPKSGIGKRQRKQQEATVIPLDISLQDISASGLALPSPEKLTLSAATLLGNSRLNISAQGTVAGSTANALPAGGEASAVGAPISAAKPLVADESALTAAKKPFFQRLKAFFKRPGGIFSRKKQAAPLEPQHMLPSNRQAAIQRAALYTASFVLGLEVATPVIANFGSSFNLSLEDNILVAVATYLPYSVGAFASNWLKKVLGRKTTLNLGLGLMGSAFLAGVYLCGLDGLFQVESNAIMHFYKALSCITIASFGGVLMHNAVGPIMTELNASASALVRQQRNSFTELARAAGMAASFAFPFISTKVLGFDWSFTFALPIPLVALAALGINVAKIPNTRPIMEAAKNLQTAIAQKSKNLWQNLFGKVKNNEYIRLFKEDPTAAPFLGALLTMNLVETASNTGFLFILNELMPNNPYQYIYGMLQFAAPFVAGRYLAGKFLEWFPKNNLTVSTLIAATSGLASLVLQDNVYALTTALALAEVGISTGFTLAFSRTATNPKTQDRLISLIVASAISCAFGPMLLTKVAQGLMDTGLMSSMGATAASLIGIPATLAFLSAGLFAKVEGITLKSIFKNIRNFFKRGGKGPKTN